jgi:hypothetical protein
MELCTDDWQTVAWERGEQLPYAAHKPVYYLADWLLASSTLCEPLQQRLPVQQQVAQNPACMPQFTAATLPQVRTRHWPFALAVVAGHSSHFVVHARPFGTTAVRDMHVRPAAPQHDQSSRRSLRRAVLAAHFLRH